MSPHRGLTGPPALKPLRGEIWEIDLNPRKGREQRGIRPCIVVSTDSLNRSSFGTIIVCPITTAHRSSFRWRPGLVPQDLRIAAASWEARPHWVETDQIVTLDTRERVLRHLATVVNPEKLARMDASLRLLLALQ